MCRKTCSSETPTIWPVVFPCPPLRAKSICMHQKQLFNISIPSEGAAVQTAFYLANVSDLLLQRQSPQRQSPPHFQSVFPLFHRFLTSLWQLPYILLLSSWQSGWRERERESRREGGYAKVLQWVLIPRDKYVLFFGVEKLNRKKYLSTCIWVNMSTLIFLQQTDPFPHTKASLGRHRL